MKKIVKKLSLNTETISKLQSDEMLKIKGGFTSIGACCQSRNNPTGCATTGASSCQGTKN
ncbi:MAG: class I lanthipeptide [Bacteroidetes bacterium]|nr:class I lanthipeptide [Bacteroidota bacterium]